MAKPSRPSDLMVASSWQANLLIRSESKEMASNYVDTTDDEGRFHSHHHLHSTNTTSTGAAASSPRTMRRSFYNGSSGSHGGSAKCIAYRRHTPGHSSDVSTAPIPRATAHPHPSPPTSPVTGDASAAPQPSSASTCTVEAQ